MTVLLSWEREYRFLFIYTATLKLLDTIKKNNKQLLSTTYNGSFRSVIQTFWSDQPPCDTGVRIYHQVPKQLSAIFSSSKTTPRFCYLEAVQTQERGSFNIKQRFIYNRCTAPHTSHKKCQFAHNRSRSSRPVSTPFSKLLEVNRYSNRVPINISTLRELIPACYLLRNSHSATRHSITVSQSFVFELRRNVRCCKYSRYQKYLNTWGLQCFLMGKPESSKGYKNLTISSILMLIFPVITIDD